MTFFEFSYLAFGVLDLYIVLICPILDFLSNKKKVITAIILVVSSILTRCFFPVLSTYIILILLFTLIFFFTGKKLIAVCLSLFNYLLSIVLSYFTLFVMEHLFKITEVEALVDYYIPYYIFLTILFVTSSYAIRIIYSSAIDKHLILPKSTSALLLIYLAICAILFIYNYSYEAALGFPQEVVRVNTILFLIFFLFTSIFIVIMMYILRRDAKLQAQNVQYESLQRYTEQVEELYQNIRGFKHDYINILSTMQLYMEQEDWVNLKTYFNTEILPTGATFQDSSQTLGQLSNLQIPELKSILYNKLVKAIELGLKVQLEIRKPITKIAVKNVDIARVIGIYLDNAIEALLELDSECPRQLSVALIDMKDSVVIIIQNNCKELSLNLHKLGTLSYTTKGKNRGMGLYLAAKTLRSYRNIQKETTYENHTFTQTLKIFNC
ncbi:MAG: GHKL domain-containing protein [Lachnospiraceae bacterium]|nr:GHKL domain-containing protein [Lachnospiraceae bacterium]